MLLGWPTHAFAPRHITTPRPSSLPGSTIPFLHRGQVVSVALLFKASHAGWPEISRILAPNMLIAHLMQRTTCSSKTLQTRRKDLQGHAGDATPPRVSLQLENLASLKKAEDKSQVRSSLQAGLSIARARAENRFSPSNAKKMEDSCPSALASGSSTFRKMEVRSL